MGRLTVRYATSARYLEICCKCVLIGAQSDRQQRRQLEREIQEGKSVIDELRDAIVIFRLQAQQQFVP